MVESGAADVEEPQVRAQVERHAAEHAEEVVRRHEAGARARQHEPALGDGLEREPVEVGVLRHGGRESLAVLRPLRGIDDQEVGALRRRGRRERAQRVEHVAVAEVDLHAVRLRVAPADLEGLLVEVHRDHGRRRAARRRGDREAARVRHPVEDAPSLRDAGDQVAMVALVEEEAGLVAAGQVDEIARAALVHLDGAGVARRIAAEPLQDRGALVGARHDALDAERLLQHALELGEALEPADAEDRDRGDGPVLVDDEPREPVRLAVDHAPRVGHVGQPQRRRRAADWRRGPSRGATPRRA